MGVWDVVGPLIVLLAAGGGGWAVWRLTPNRRSTAEIDARRRLAAAEARRWAAMAGLAGDRAQKGPEMDWTDLSDGELHARIANCRPDMPDEVIGVLVRHREDSTDTIIIDILEGRR